MARSLPRALLTAARARATIGPMRFGHTLTLALTQAFSLALVVGVFGCASAPPKSRLSMRAGAQHPEKDDDPTTPPPSLDLPGVDLSGLKPLERKVLAKVVRELTSPCGDPATLETCVKERRACKRCLPAAQLAVK